MVSNTHYIELYINRKLVELESQESLHLRMNSVLFNPTRTSTKQAEYSFSFDIPSTPNNDKILDYANNLSKINKFHTRYSAQVYADGSLVFDGSLTIKSYDGKDKMYNCNLVNIKINTLEEIFDEDVLTDVKWYVDFDGANTINSVNADLSTKYYFPLVSYGAFQKKPQEIDEDDPALNKYTSIYRIDSSNKWWVSSFYPSLNMLEEVKKCFEWKGYTVGGDAFSDPILSEIYLSTNLAEDYNPTYNVGNPKFGRLSLGVTWSGSSNPHDTHDSFYNVKQDLKFPYFPATGGFYLFDYQNDTLEKEVEQWNFNQILVQNMLAAGDVTIDSASTMFDSAGGDIIINSDGLYKITMEGTVHLTQTDDITADQYVHEWDASMGTISSTATTKTITFHPSMRITTPIEIQLIKNEDGNIELIKGGNNIQIYDGYPDNETEMNKGRKSNYNNYRSCFPHEKQGFPFTTKYKQISDSSTSFWLGDIGGYVNDYGDYMCYDPVVSPAFICGMTTMGNKDGGGTTAVIKNGYSWSKTYSERTDSWYLQPGYMQYTYNTTTGEFEYVRTNFNANSFPNNPSPYFYQTGPLASFRVYAMVWLKKNDILDLVAIRRNYYCGSTHVSYSCEANVHLDIEAISPKNIFTAQATNVGWNTPTEFPKKLNLMEFTNKDVKISEWLKNIQTAFNLSYEMNGNTVDVNINKGIKKNILNAVNIDDRVNSNEVESEYISYPKEMSIKFKIDADEYGFKASVPPEHINDDDWKNWGESGYTVIKLNDDSYETSSQKTNTQFSYTWYESKFYTQYTSLSEKKYFTIPVISKDEYFIDGYNYIEMQKHRGFQLSQRFWFRPKTSLGLETECFYLENDYDLIQPINWNHPIPEPKKVDPYGTEPMLNGFNLSYKDTETSIATEYFNIHPMLASNYVNVETFLNPMEYIQIKGGALVHFDSDLYYTSEISGYDPSGANPTKLKLIKKI